MSQRAQSSMVQSTAWNPHIRTQLPPIFERSFEQSDIASSISPSTANELYNYLNKGDRSLSSDLAGPGLFNSNSHVSEQPHQNPAFMQSEDNAFLLNTVSVSHSSVPLKHSLVEGLLEDEEKWPVAQKQAMIVVTRTYKEDKTKQRKRTVVASICLVILLAWLIWALVFTI